MEFDENMPVLEYLEHYGILGQKWGIRRFQNPDGSLTEAGKKRYLIKGTNIDKRDLKTPEGRKDARKKAASEAINEILTTDDEKKAYAKLYENAEQAEIEYSYPTMSKKSFDELEEKYYDAADKEFQVYKKMASNYKSKVNGRIKEDDITDTGTAMWDAMLETNPYFKEAFSRINKAWIDADNAYEASKNNVKHSALTEDSPISDALAHYGTQGMKWGIRRYQNEDGTLTALGRIHYGLVPHVGKGKPLPNPFKKKEKKEDGDSSESKSPEKELSKEDIMKSGDAKLILKNMDKLTDSELQAAYNRANTVRNLQNLTPSEAKKKDPNLFQKGVKTITDAMVAELASELTATAKVGVKSVGEKVINTVFADDNVKRNSMLKSIGVKTDKEKAEEERARMVKNLIQAGNKTEILKNVNKMTNQEIADAARRMQNINNIATGSKDPTIEQLLEALKEKE